MAKRECTSRALAPASSGVPPPKRSTVLSEQALADERVERASDLSKYTRHVCATYDEPLRQLSHPLAVCQSIYDPS